MYRCPPAPVIVLRTRRNGPAMWRHAPAAAGFVGAARGGTAGPKPAVTVATEAARATALLSRGASFIVSSRGAARRPRSPAPPLTPVILRQSNPSETAGFHAGPPPRGPEDSAVPIMLGGDTETGRFSLRRICHPPRATGRAAQRL